jgi:hypothetical protein
VAELHWLGSLRRFRLPPLLCLLGALLCPGEVRAGADLFALPVQIDDFRMPLYLDFNPSPVAVFRARNLHHDHQRRGFFRIGVLPLVVGKGVTLEICAPERATNALFQVEEKISGFSNGSAIELRDLTIRFTSEAEPRLQAATARLQHDGQWRLEGVILHSATNIVRAAHGLLQASGVQAGRLTWDASTGLAPVNLFTLSSSNHQRPKD